MFLVGSVVMTGQPVDSFALPAEAELLGQCHFWVTEPRTTLYRSRGKVLCMDDGDGRAETRLHGGQQVDTEG